MQKRQSSNGDSVSKIVAADFWIDKFDYSNQIALNNKDLSVYYHQTTFQLELHQSQNKQVFVTREAILKPNTPLLQTSLELASKNGSLDLYFHNQHTLSLEQYIRTLEECIAHNLKDSISLMLMNQPLLIKTCGHSFQKESIERWSIQRRKCPLC